MSMSVACVTIMSWYVLSLGDQGGYVIIQMGWSPQLGVQSWVYAYQSVLLGCVQRFCDMYHCDCMGLCSYLGFLVFFSCY